MERKMYVIQRSDGKFYWKGNSSSLWGYKVGFENAHLFKTMIGAYQRSRLDVPKGMSTEVLEVTLTLSK